MKRFENQLDEYKFWWHLIERDYSRKILTDFDLWHMDRLARSCMALRILGIPESTLRMNIKNMDGAVICQVARMSIEDQNPIPWQDAVKWCMQAENRSWLVAKMKEARDKFWELKNGEQNPSSTAGTNRADNGILMDTKGQGQPI